MADPGEDKGFLTAKLEEDRQKMAFEVSELKEGLNIARWFEASVRANPWGWSIAAMLIGFLVSRLPERKKEVYLWADPLTGKPVRKVPVRNMKPDHAMKDNGVADKVWLLIKPLLSAYIGRRIYERLVRMGQDGFDRGKAPRIIR